MGWLLLVLFVGLLIWALSGRFSARDQPNVPRTWWGSQGGGVDHDYWEKWRAERSEQRKEKEVRPVACFEPEEVAKQLTDETGDQWSVEDVKKSLGSLGDFEDVVHYERQDLLNAQLCGAPSGAVVTSYCPDVTCADCKAYWVKVSGRPWRAEWSGQMRKEREGRE